MNDCIYNWILACEQCNCVDCPHYCSVNSREGTKIYGAYQSDVDEALEPVHEKWIAIFQNLGELS